jgi:putative glutamine amidotransferase
VPWIVPLVHEDAETLRALYEQLDGVFLPGGVDIDPQTYKEERHPFCGRTDPARDWTELMLTHWAMEDRKPLLAVCRGAQLINVAAGGTLYQDLSAQLAHAIKHDYFPTQDRYSRDMRAHDVRLAEGSRLARVLGRSHLVVNSMHHQGIKELAPGLIATAFAPDGLVEGVEATDGHFMLGVQWHPEDLVDCEPCMRLLFDAFIAAARDGDFVGVGLVVLLPNALDPHLEVRARLGAGGDDRAHGLHAGRSEVVRGLVLPLDRQRDLKPHGLPHQRLPRERPALPRVEVDRESSATQRPACNT